MKKTILVLACSVIVSLTATAQEAKSMIVTPKQREGSASACSAIPTATTCVVDFSLFQCLRGEPTS